MCITRLFYHLARFKETTLPIGKDKLKLYLADGFLNQAVGLMYREKLGRKEGMLFITKKDSTQGIWMLNMKFNIDILWLDSKGAIVDMVENAEPCSSIFSCKVYIPKKKARYVLELNTGQARLMGLKIGSIINIGSSP